MGSEAVSVSCLPLPWYPASVVLGKQLATTHLHKSLSLHAIASPGNVFVQQVTPHPVDVGARRSKLQLAQIRRGSPRGHKTDNMAWHRNAISQRAFTSSASEKATGLSPYPARLAQNVRASFLAVDGFIRVSLGSPPGQPRWMERRVRGGLRRIRHL